MTDTEIVDALLALHVPEEIPEGKVWMGARKGHPEDAPCASCQTGDPCLDETWPCPTRRLIDEGRASQ